LPWRANKQSIRSWRSGWRTSCRIAVPTAPDCARDRYALSHRRLAIVDRSGGSQPMGTPDERLWVTYNGEIYNFVDLRAELEQGVRVPDLERH
jgi:asparagine synthetase B (glutamine-hydrolysing)